MSDPVAALMQRVGAEIVIPRFRNLADDEVVEKTPGELVTVADREAELQLTAGLRAIDPAARVIGEEAVAADPALLDGIGRGRLWLVDPIDGTANYAAGRAPFGIMIALVDDGAVQAGWLYDPLTARLCRARLGDGAFVDGRRIVAHGTGGARPVAALATIYMGPEERDRLAARAEGTMTIVPIPRCAAEQYPRIALGENDIGLFRRTLPWDHAAGSLFLTEAGGRVARLDGAPYRVGDGQTGLLAAATPGLWDQASAALFDG